MITVTTAGETCTVFYPEPLPRGDLPGWRQVAAVDFTTPVPIGGFVPATSGVLTNAGLAGYNAYGPGRPGGALLEMYPDGWHTTGGVSGLQAPKQCVSAITNVPGANGVLDIHNHTVTIGAETKPGTAVIHPVLSTGKSKLGPYGRYQFRMRTLGYNAKPSGYSIVPLAIDSNDWPGAGELDWPEGDAHQETLVNGWYHRADPAGSQQRTVSNGVAVFGDWHIYTVEWTPGRMQWWVDDFKALDSTVMVPTKALYVVIQGDVNRTTPAAATTTGHVQVDWFAAWEKM